MFGTGFLTALRGLGWWAKVAVASTAAVLTMTAAVAAAVVLPSDGGDSDSAVVHTATADGGVAVEPANPTTTAGADVQAGGEASVAAAGGPASPTANARGAGEAVANQSTTLPSVPVPTVPTSVAGPGGMLPDVSALADIPNQVMSCLAPVFDLVSSFPAMPSMEQITQIGPTIVGCVSAIVEDLPLPFGLNACISEIMGFVRDITSQVPSGIPDVGDLDVAACIPSGLPVPTGFSGGSFMGGGFPFGR